MNRENRFNRPFLVCTILFLLLIFLDRLIPEGMFFDGLTYASLARNLAIGKASFWQPFYTGPFWDHPPLMIAMEALFFKMFGNEYYTEKIYSLVIWLFTLLSIAVLWRKIKKDEKYNSVFWLPLLLWNISPIVVWGYPNNLLDTTLALFDLFAVILMYNGLQKTNSFYNFLAAGCLLFLASMTKGVVGFFPIGVPMIYYIVFRKPRFSMVMLWTLLLVSMLVLFYFILWQYPQPRAYLTYYLDNQLFAALAGKREKVDSVLGRFTIISDMLIQLIPAIIIGFIVFFTGRLLKIKTSNIPRLNEASVSSAEPLAKNQQTNSRSITALNRLCYRKPGKIQYIMRGQKDAFFFLLVGLSASVPLMVSVKQRAFYLIPSIPYFAIAAALIIAPLFYSLVQHSYSTGFKRKILNGSLVLASVVSLYYLGSKIGTVGRDADLIHDIKQFTLYIPKGEQIGLCHECEEDWKFIAYIQRYHELIPASYKNTHYVLLDKKNCSSTFLDSLQLSGFYEVPLPTIQYVLYKK